ncbi:AAA family ATPase [Hoyosella rhizosphaerae]|uniref:Magnesium-chelatase 38 kDa subunit n=1 Tax=Hoyosella rhizosphaerae TaxID=1755582 RepID=A0A916UL98_9ACTN|nr:AAA family ATPase [Hoyosella rhizosphaerae]MBN4925455.1 AAA family ATPase [Hoyosella rhizosphaerae]GGC75059.1 magnesium-chelatase 38 kDa subunit [Hoyosella rhizosphaerae]
MTPQFPFTAILGQEELKRCLLLTAIDPAIGGVLAMGDRGTAKSTTVRALADMLALARIEAPVVDLPLGASEDRLLGALDIDAALTQGEVRFRPGLLHEAHRGFLYIDEVNLLDDYLVDLLLDVAASGVNRVERDGISHQHDAQFVLIGSGNPEEGELRPQLEDRFGLSTHVSTIRDVEQRTEIVRRRLLFDATPDLLIEQFRAQQAELARSVGEARQRLADVTVTDNISEAAIRLCIECDVVGHRGEIVLIRAARAAAALRGADEMSCRDLATVAVPALRHRIPREPFESPTTASARVHNIAARTLRLHSVA